MTNSAFNGQRYRCSIYCAFQDHILVHLCCKTKIVDPPKQYFYIFYGAPNGSKIVFFGEGDTSSEIEILLVDSEILLQRSRDTSCG